MSRMTIIMVAITASLIMLVGEKNAYSQHNLESVYILNEGNFNAGNGSITRVPFINSLPQSPIQNAYAKANSGLPLGDLIQSSHRIGNELWLVISNSHKIERVDVFTLKRLGTIRFTGSPGPREIATSNGYAFVTLQNSDQVAVINLDSYFVVQNINVGSRPEGITASNGRIFVANSGFGSGRTISILNAQTLAIETTIDVCDNPTAVKSTGNGEVWVLCSGAYNNFADPNDDTPGMLRKIGSLTLEASEPKIIGGHPSRLAVSTSTKELLFITETGVGKLRYDLPNAEPTLFIPGFYYGLGVFDNGGSSLIAVTDAKNYIQAGSIEWFNMSGMKIASTVAGIIPGSVAFISSIPTSIEEDKNFVDKPVSMEIISSYPNPFNPETNLSIQVNRAQNITIDMLDATGRIVYRNSKGFVAAGSNTSRIHVPGLASGVYIIRVFGDYDTITHKVTLLR